MRGLVRYGVVLGLGAALTACSSGIGTVRLPTIVTPTGTTTASPLDGVLPVPAGAQPWSSNTDKLMSADAFIQAFYVKSAWTEEESLLPRRGFVSGVIEGWTNADGSQQEIVIYSFATANGAQSQFDGLTGTLRDKPAPATVLTDPADGGVGTVSPTLDSLGNAVAEIAAHTGGYVIDVHEFTAAAPDPAAAKALLLRQYNLLRSAAS